MSNAFERSKYMFIGAEFTPNLEWHDSHSQSYFNADNVKPDSHRTTMEEVKKWKFLKRSIKGTLNVLKIYTEKLKKDSEKKRTISLKCGCM